VLTLLAVPLAAVRDANKRGTVDATFADLWAEGAIRWIWS